MDFDLWRHVSWVLNVILSEVKIYRNENFNKPKLIQVRPGIEELWRPRRDIDEVSYGD